MAPRRLTHLLASAVLSGPLGCEQAAPPGATAAAEPAVVVVAPSASSEEATAMARSGAGPEPGSLDDNLPFSPEGSLLASIAWRTWVYTDVGPRRTRYGYLRAGTVVPRRGPEIVNAGCAGGWWRINPRGFVCVGKGATLDLEHPVVRIASGRPTRGSGLPYGYALARERPPHLYFRFPNETDMNRSEGRRWVSDAANFRAKAMADETWAGLAEVGPPPPHLASLDVLEKPYGVKKRLHYRAHAGTASSESGFAFHEVYEHHGRLFALTTEHDVIALDRTRVVRPSAFHGVELGEGHDLPAAFVTKRWALRYERAPSGQLEPKGSFSFRQGLDLTGETLKYEGVGFWETTEGSWVPASSITLLRPRTSFPSVATGARKWIDVSIRDQTLVAYEGKKAVYVTLISSGRGGMGDPDEVPATVRGTFMIHAKHVTATMDGEEDVSDSFALGDVPFVQYFHKGYALHGTYWHDDFGKIRSHGCINLAPVDAAWLFEWTDPEVPSTWHAAINKERGTVVHIHP